MSLTRSHWHWGYSERLPDEGAREALGGMVEAFLGVSLPPPCALPDPAAARIAASRRRVPEGFEAIVTDAPTVRRDHTYGRAWRDLYRGFVGDFSAAPDLVARPRHEDDVAALLAWASREGVVVTPYGGGTSVVAGIEADRDAHPATLTLSLAALNRVLGVDPIDRLADIEAGATGPEIEAQLGPFTLRHYPQSFEFSTLGGWIATRAGGHFATRYTHIDDRVTAVRMLTPAGVWQSARVPASGAGIDPVRLVCGSEGTLGVITRATVRVLPRPRWRHAASLRFEHFHDAVEAARRVAQSELAPANCRVLDATEALINRVSGADQASVLLLGTESADSDPIADLERCVALAQSAGGRLIALKRREDDGAREATGASWREAFLDGPYLQSALLTLGVLVDTFETATTWSRFATLDRALREALHEVLVRTGGAGHVSCRFTHVYPDGPAPYYTFFTRIAPHDPLGQWAAIKHAVSEVLSAHGATITHHHAVGRTHRPWFARETPAPYRTVHEAMRRALDPAAILAPGVLFDRE